MRKKNPTFTPDSAPVRELSAAIAHQGWEISRVHTFTNNSFLLEVPALNLQFHGKPGNDEFYLVSRVQREFKQDVFIDKGPFAASFVELDGQLAIRTGAYKIHETNANFQKIIEVHYREVKEAKYTPYFRDLDQNSTIENTRRLEPPRSFIKTDNYRILKSRIDLMLVDTQRIINIWGKRGQGKNATVLQILNEGNFEVFKLENEGGKDQNTLVKYYQQVQKDLVKIKKGALLISPIVGNLMAKGAIYCMYDLLASFLLECSGQFPVVVLSQPQIGPSIPNNYAFVEEEDEIFLGEVIKLRSGVGKIEIYPSSGPIANPLYSILKNKSLCRN